MYHVKRTRACIIYMASVASSSLDDDLRFECTSVLTKLDTALPIVDEGSLVQYDFEDNYS